MRALLPVLLATVAGVSGCTGAADTGATARPPSSVPTSSSVSVPPSQVPGGGATSASPSVTGDADGTTAGGRNGIEKLPADQILARAREVGRAAGSVHLVGESEQEGQPVTIDVRVGKDRGEAQLGLVDSTATLRRVGSTAYATGDKAFYESFSGSAAEATRIQGKWLTGPVASADFAGLVDHLSFDDIVDQLLKPPGKLRKGDITTVGGRRAVTVIDEQTGSPFSVATEGPPYVLRIESGPKVANKGSFTLSEWGTPVQVQAPPVGERVKLSEVGNG